MRYLDAYRQEQRTFLPDSDFPGGGALHEGDAVDVSYIPADPHRSRPDASSLDRDPVTPVMVGRD